MFPNFQIIMLLLEYIFAIVTLYLAFAVPVVICMRIRHRTYILEKLLWCALFAFFIWFNDFLGDYRIPAIAGWLLAFPWRLQVEVKPFSELFQERSKKPKSYQYLGDKVFGAIDNSQIEKKKEPLTYNKPKKRPKTAFNPAKSYIDDHSYLYKTGRSDSNYFNEENDLLETRLVPEIPQGPKAPLNLGGYKKIEDLEEEESELRTDYIGFTRLVNLN